MMKSNKQRQAEYRARRKKAGLCAWPGCERKPHKYTYCPEHRQGERERARERTVMAEAYETMQEDRDRLAAELAEARAGRDFYLNLAAER